MDLLIKNGRVIDPSNDIDEILDILVSDGKILRVEKDIQADCDCINAEGLWVVPGLIDLHVHFREPGFEYKEDTQSGSRSAAAGGFTTVVCMANTKPVIDTEEKIKEALSKQTIINLAQVGAITKNLGGEILADLRSMKSAAAFSEDGRTVMNAGLMRDAMKIASEENKVILAHCEDLSLGTGNDSEEVIVARDIVLASSENAPLHICHMSTEMSVQLLREAKARGQRVSGEVSPHHFSLCEDDMPSNDANFKMAPPLRKKSDRQAIINGLLDNTIEVIATDHAPHHESEKNCEFAKAANGIIGLETAVGLCITNLVNANGMTPKQLIRKLTQNPARILGLDKGTLSQSKTADITIIDPNKKWTVEPAKFYSKSRNTPFGGMELMGKVMVTIVSGEIVYEFTAEGDLK